MKKLFTIIAAALVCAGSAAAQELANVNMGRQQIVSPEIGDEYVTFRLAADYATVVKLSGSWMANPYGDTIDMKKENGVWSVTIPTPSPEIYTYNFVVDGVSVNDPVNYLVQRDGTRYLNMLMVPGERTANYFECDRRGTVSFMWYDSSILGINRRLTVYLPYGYEAKANARKKYPVLYLLHGAGGDEEAWISMGRTAQILDNLIAQGKASPMIVVMPNGNPNQQAACTLGTVNTDLNQRDPAFANAYVRSLCEEIVPFIEKNFRVNAKPESRAVAGLSMGGGHTISASCLYPALFDYICPLSAAGSATDEQVTTLRKAGVKLYFLACGTDDFLYEGSKTLDATLTKNGLTHVFYQSDGGHTWANWRLYLNTFAPMLFK